jgi:hypothetical protein
LPPAFLIVALRRELGGVFLRIGDVLLGDQIDQRLRLGHLTAEIPFYQPQRFEVVLNLKAASETFDHLIG